MQTRFRFSLLVAITCAAFFTATGVSASAQTTAAQQAKPRQLPAQLSDSAFWGLITDLSEPEQSFTTYMVSNEVFYPNLVVALMNLNLKGGAYVGVAPEQNYHYIAALKPQVAFVLDIRRQAVIQHLMFKAVFELAENRADFVSLLFTKPRPQGLANTASAFDTWTAFWYIPTDTSKFKGNFARIFDHLTKKHKFAFSAYDSTLLYNTYFAFYASGPNIVSNGGTSGNDASPSTFGNLTSARDGSGVERSFLANDEGYQVIRQLELKNLIIPIVGDFAGTHALRSIGQYLRDNSVQLSAFYVSNVETYLNRDGKGPAFYANLGTMPFHATSAMIRGISPGRMCNVQQMVSIGFGGC